MDYKEIKKLMDDMGNSQLSEMEIIFPDGIKISMKKDEKKQKEFVSLPVATSEEEISMSSGRMPISNSITNSVPSVTVTTSPIVSKEPKKEGKIVTSPMVGTFYAKPSPKAEPFVTVGSKVKKGDILCVIEAMKLMNEIESEYEGEIIEVLVKDEEMVEYGKPLFVIQ